MIRPFTCVCMLLAGASGLYLYQSKHRAQMLDREIGRTIKQTETTRERIGMLRAEWALLNEPDRLTDLARQHLGLRTLAPGQFAALTDLAARLPAPVAPGTPLAPPGDTEEAAAQPPAPPQAAAAPPPPPKPIISRAPAPVVTAEVRPPAPAKPAAPARPAPQLASLPAPVPTSAGQNPATAPGTIGEAVLRAGRVPVAAAPSQAYAPPAASAYVPPPAISMVSVSSSQPASVLGGSRTALPPPVPYGGR